jgi:TIR domain
MDNKREEEYKYRIFISYSHDDKDRVEKLARILEENGLNPVYDKHLEGGFGFTDTIKKLISHAHVFVPLITESSSQRGWVHQEIGYATALNIPIMPVMIDATPAAMIQQVQALHWDDNEKNLKKIMSLERFTNLVEDAQKSMSQRDISPLFECGLLRDDRTKLMVRYASDISKLGFSGHVRQKGALSSFHLPDKSLNDPVYDIRYGNEPPGEYRYRWIRLERQELEKHARVSGCSIIIDPYLSYTERGPKARIVRLEELLEFLRSMPDDKVNVGIKKGLSKEEHLTIVGDWFAADAFSNKGKGYLQTMFTRHAPFVINCIKAFDEDLEYLMKRQGTSCSSREYAIQIIEQIVDELNKELKNDMTKINDTDYV